MIERRKVLWLPFALAGASLLHGARACAAQGADAAAAAAAANGASPAPESVFTPLTMEELGERWRDLARELAPLPKVHDESYAAALAALIARVPIDALPRLEPTSQDRRASGGLVGGPSWFLAPCVIIEFRMEPGAEIRLHNHPPQVVLTLAVEGEARYRHLEIEGAAPPCTKIDGVRFHVRETRRGALSPGRSTTLTRARDGIHGFVAGEKGARILDFTIGLSADMETFSYLELGDDALDEEGTRFEAVWLGKK